MSSVEPASQPGKNTHSFSFNCIEYSFAGMGFSLKNNSANANVNVFHFYHHFSCCGICICLVHL